MFQRNLLLPYAGLKNYPDDRVIRCLWNWNLPTKQQGIASHKTTNLLSSFMWTRQFGRQVHHFRNVLSPPSGWKHLVPWSLKQHILKNGACVSNYIENHNLNINLYENYIFHFMNCLPFCLVCFSVGYKSNVKFCLVFRKKGQKLC